MIPIRGKYAPGFCVYPPGYTEVRWDVVGCNLQCHFCWSPASRPLVSGEASTLRTPRDILRETRRRVANPRSTFIRFTGGEPTLYWMELLETLGLFQADEGMSQVPVLIQTNGIEIGSGNAELHPETFKSSQPYLFELSFKGTSRGEFSILTGGSADLYTLQLRAWHLLTDLSHICPNVSVIAVLGVYHSALKRSSKYAFVNPADERPLFEEPEGWDGGFRDVWQKAALKWVEPLRMSPKGVWDNLWRRCGPDGVGILRSFPRGLATNTANLFPPKPRTHEYARLIAEREFWRRASGTRGT